MSRPEEDLKSGIAEVAATTNILPPHSPINLDLTDEDEMPPVVAAFSPIVVEGEEVVSNDEVLGAAEENVEAEIEAEVEGVEAIEDFVPGTAVRVIRVQQLGGLDRSGRG
jgi:hypothetical protein